MTFLSRRQALPALMLFFAFALPVSAGGGVTYPGDEEFVRGAYANAVASYDSMLASSREPAQIFWRLARVHVCIADMAEKDQKEAIYRKAEKFARECIRADTSVGEGHTWLAAALGNIAMFEGSKAKVELCTEIKMHLDRAIALNPSDDIAWSILGSFYLALGNVSWLERQLAAVFIGRLPDGGYEDAERALRSAITIAPKVIRHHYELASTLRAMGRPEDALAEYRLATNLPPQLASDPRTQERAKKWIEHLSE